MKKYHSPILLFALALFLITSCEKVIDIDLNSKDPKIVIEGNIDDRPGPYYVRLSTSVNFDEPNNFPSISGARITISDNQAGTDTLLEVSPGLYQTINTQGIPGHVYSLNVVTAAGQTFTATCRMPDLVPYDSLTLDSVNLFGQIFYNFTPTYTDPLTEDNSYRFVVYHNSELLDEDIVFGDRFNNGLVNTQPIFTDQEWISGDTATVIKQDIDKVIYDYFNALILNNDNAAPANPPSNISNGALGFFSAHTWRSRSLIIP